MDKYTIDLNETVESGQVWRVMTRADEYRLLDSQDNERRRVTH